MVAEWRANGQVCDWARLSPALTGVDLRPYLFVTKDKKDYFGAVSALGHLAGVVDKLLGAKWAVHALETDLKQLAQAEAETVFEALRSKIMAAGVFNVAPAGVDGLTVLVKAQPGLQSRLMDFLEALPDGRSGPWAVQGWHKVVKDAECKERLQCRLRDWTMVKDNKLLKAAATAALKEMKGAR